MKALPGQMQHLLSDRGKAEFRGGGTPQAGSQSCAGTGATIAAASAREYPERNEARTTTVRPITEVISEAHPSCSGAPYCWRLSLACAQVWSAKLAHPSRGGQPVKPRAPVEL